MKSIRSKIMLGIVSTGLASVLLLGVSAAFFSYQSTTELLQKNTTEMATLAAQRVNKEILAYENVAIDAGGTSRLANPETLLQDKQDLISQRASAHNFERATVLDATGKDIFSGTDFSDREYFQQAMQGKTTISDPVISKVTGKLTFIVAAPLWKDGVPNSSAIGAVYFVPKETFMNDIVATIHVSENCRAYIINASGDDIADSTAENVMNLNVEQQAQSDSTMAGLAALHTKMRAGETGTGEYSSAGQTNIIAYAPIDGTNGWSIAVTAPISDFMDGTIRSIAVSVILMVVMGIFAVLISVWMSGKIANPIRQCSDRLRLLSEGDLSSPLPVIKNKDEAGVLAASTNALMTTLNGIIKDIGWLLDQMAEGKLNTASRVPEMYAGDFRQIRDALGTVSVRLSATLEQVTTAADQVSAGSDQVSAGAQALSQGATEQASSIEEIAATINEISNHIRNTADNAAKAREQSSQASGKVRSCNANMQRMVGAMEEINEKSQQIGKIIKTIEDIAFQTNILALNAAVEAARAGEAGKGFAVVADEVRNLATKSANASSSTAALIENSVQAVQKGSEIASVTAAALEEVAESTRQSAELVDKIAEEAKEESSTVVQVTQGIDQISGVVQNNSATAEESAAASEELSAQAQMLKDLIENFTLMHETAPTQQSAE